MPGLEPHVADAIQASEARIVIAGAGGWIGLATLDLLKAAIGDRWRDRVHCFGSAARTLTLRDGESIEQSALADLSALAPAPTILLHLAFLTKERAETLDEATYRAANRSIDSSILAALDPIGVKAILVASSGAAVRADDPAASHAMRLYGSLKRDQERTFADWATRTNRRAVIARLFNLSGPYINKQHSYALSAFILDALAGGPIRVHAPHRVVRSYVAIRELMSLAFAMLLDERAAVVRFDSGGEAMEMQAIAEAVAGQFGDLAVDRPAIDPERFDDYRGDSQTYSQLLAEHRIVPMPFARQLAETVDYLAFSRVQAEGSGLALGGPA